MKFISPRRTYMSDSIEALQSALATVNTLGEQLTQGVGSLQNHNTDPEAHDDIRQTLRDLMDSDNVYTKDQINTVVENKIKEHTDLTIEGGAHNGAAFKTWIEEEISRLEAAIEQGGGGSGGGGSSSEDPNTNALLAKIQAIADSYAALLSSLQSAYNEAIASGQDELAAGLLESLKQTLAQQLQEMLDALAEFNAHYTDEELPDPATKEELDQLKTRVENIASALDTLTGRVTSLASQLDALFTDYTGEVFDSSTPVEEPVVDEES